MIAPTLITALCLATSPAWDYAVLPIAFYTPETAMALGAGSFVFQPADASGRRGRANDQLALVAIGTTRQQFVLGVEGTSYQNGDRFRLNGTLAASHYPNRFWGVGNDTPAGYDRFTPTRLRAGLGVAVRTIADLYLGMEVSAAVFTVGGYAPDGDVAGYLARHQPGGHLLGAGPVLHRDTRDDTLFPRSGSTTAIGMQVFGSGLGSSHGYVALDADQRWYLATGERAVLALQGHAEWRAGDVPLSDLPALGGASRLRGFYEGRYRDHLYLMAQAEWRLPLFWRLAVAPFAAAGDVFPDPASLSADRLKLAGGLGLRCNLKTDRTVNLRVDIARSRETTSVYVHLGEAF